MDVALGFMHSPRLLFLDEPSTGMDPQNRANLWEHIMRMRAEHGTTIVLTTHYMDEADSMSERVIVIDHGPSSPTTPLPGSRPTWPATCWPLTLRPVPAADVRGLLGRAAAEGEIQENAYDGVVRFRLRLALKAPGWRPRC